MIHSIRKTLSSKLIQRRYSNKSYVNIIEVGPRDGLQFEKQILPTNIKVELINRLTLSGFSHIECGSFVNPKRLPQLTDSSEVISQISINPNTRYSTLVPNSKGIQRALNSNIKTIAIFGAASDLFSRKNINCSVEESFNRFDEVVKVAKENDIEVRGYVSCVIACPYAGKTDPGFVAEITGKMLEMGCYEVSLGDTIGVGTPDSFSALLKTVLHHCDVSKLALHCHDTNGQAIMNITRGLEHGIRAVDSSIAGLGGCPYAGPGASGNVATERVIALLSKLGCLEPCIDVEKVKETAAWISAILKKKQ